MFSAHPRSFFGFLAVLFGLVFVGVPSSSALDVPKLEGRVNDYAGMLSPGTERQLEQLLDQLEQADSTQIVVLTVPSLEGEVLENYSIRVAEQWQIGQKSADNGAILLIAKRERKLRIEVGYGLEGRLTDLVAGRIIRNVMVPYFRSGQIDQGVVEGVQAMIAVVKGEYTAPAAPLRDGRRRSSGSGSLFTLVVFAFLINFLGRLRRSLGAVAGGLLFPIIGALFFGLPLLWVLLLMPIGLIAGLIMSLFGGPMSFAHHRGSSRHGGGIWFGGGGGGFSSGGFGGFSGGGGSFGGGGASGGW